MNKHKNIRVSCVFLLLVASTFFFTKVSPAYGDTAPSPPVKGSQVTPGDIAKAIREGMKAQGKAAKVKTTGQGPAAPGKRGKASPPSPPPSAVKRRSVAPVTPPSIPEEGLITVLPEVTTTVNMSASDINRIVCQEPIKDVIFSEEKGITVNVSGNNAFVKFKPSRKAAGGGMQTVYSSNPAEFFIICGPSVYSIVAVPKRITPQTVFLSTGKRRAIEENLDLYAGMPFEKKIVDILEQIYKGDISEYFDVKKKNIAFDLFDDLNVLLRQVIIVEGEGLRIKSYYLTLKPSAGDKKIDLHEKFFLLPELAERAVSVSLEKLSITKNDIVRLFIVETVNASQGALK